MGKARARKPPVAVEHTVETLSRVVGIGASAGGLEAVQEFLGALKPDGSAYVVAQHLAPDHPSLIVELLSHSTTLRVVEAIDGEQLAPDSVAVGPPNRDLTIVAGRLHLVEPAERPGPSPNIDLLFESLAEEWGVRAVAVVLSGTGSDGAHGMQAIRSAGGLTFVQSPDSAKFDGMPRAAIALGGVDLVLDARSLGERLASLTPGSGIIGESLPLAGGDGLASIIAQLREATNLDFSGYKEPTLRRQVQRRMAIRQVGDMDAYLALLVDDVDEAHALAGNLLVTVTSFFRDPDAFDALRAAFVTYLAGRDPGDVVRVWVPGCATGEEVYTIAMLVSEALGRPADLASRLKVFGSDVDDASLTFARRAEYSSSAMARVPESLRDAYSRETSGGFRIIDSLRECTVFARHDVGVDAPFPRMDLVSCRNMLIYFTPPLQDRVIGMFGFALRAGGLLFLGSAENIDPKTVGFQVVDADRRIFRRTSEVATGFVRSRGKLSERADGSDPIRIPQALARNAPSSGLERQVAILEAVLRQGGKAFLTLDDAHQLVEVVGDVGPYCRVPEGRMTGAVVSFLRPELQEEARALLLLCRTGTEPVVGQSISLADLGSAVHLVATRVPVDDAFFTTLVFEPDEAEPAASLTSVRAPDFDRELRWLERELIVSQDTLRRSLAELQAANEELEASAEELQASNEELGLTNRELTVRGDDLAAVNGDLENIQASLSQGMVIVNKDLRVTRFTPIAVRVFALLASDIGRPLLSVPTTLQIPGFEAALRGVAAGGRRVSIEAGDGRVAYLVQVLPYLAPDGRRLGAIVTLTDVSEMVELRKVAENAFIELKDKSELLEHEATFDAVTGLVNRGHFANLLESAVALASEADSSLALAWINVDRFKEVNDEYGHGAGDAALRVIGQRVLRRVRGSDAVGRLGGDEFGVIISGYGSPTELDMMLKRIVSSTRESVTFGGQEVWVTTSVGVARFPEDSQSPKDLLRVADAAMYAVKRQSGDGYAYFDESMNEAGGAGQLRRREIAAAIENGEFVMHYQPVVDASTGAVRNVEALVRWQREGEIVSAAEFVPFCESSGQIRALGMVTMSLVRADAEVLWAAGHRDLRVAVNMSVTQLEDLHFGDMLKGFPTPDGLSGVIIEILESVFLPDHGQALGMIDRLSELGAQISIDDYGSGYSNFRLLQTLKPDYIKLDRSFVSEHHAAGSSAALVRAGVEIGHVVGARVVAEGIETEEQHELVRQAGVDLVQGFGVARPMSLEALLDWLRDRPAR